MEENKEEILTLLEKSLNELQRAKKDVGYASSYTQNRASTTYCGYASSSLREAEQNLIKAINLVLSETKEQEDNSQVQEFTK